MCKERTVSEAAEEPTRLLWRRNVGHELFRVVCQQQFSRAVAPTPPTSPPALSLLVAPVTVARLLVIVVIVVIVVVRTTIGGGVAIVVVALVVVVAPPAFVFTVRPFSKPAHKTIDGSYLVLCHTCHILQPFRATPRLLLRLLSLRSLRSLPLLLQRPAASEKVLRTGLLKQTPRRLRFTALLFLRPIAKTWNHTTPTTTTTTTTTAAVAYPFCFSPFFPSPFFDESPALRSNTPVEIARVRIVQFPHRRIPRAEQAPH